MIGIYIIKNIVNGKVYIGQSWNVRSRLADHKRDLKKGISGNIHLQRAYNKYGKDNFIFKPLVDLSYISNLDKEEAQKILDDCEKYWIDFFGGHNNSNTYNIKEGGYGGTYSEEYKHTLSVQRKGKYSGVNNPMYGKHHSDITKQKISCNRKGKGCGRKVVITQEQKEKISKANKGRVQSNEEKLKRSETMKRVRKTEEYLQNYKEGIKKAGFARRKYSDDFVKKLRNEHSGGISIKKLSLKYDIPFESCRLMINGEQRFKDIV